MYIVNNHLNIIISLYIYYFTEKHPLKMLFNVNN